MLILKSSAYKLSPPMTVLDGQRGASALAVSFPLDQQKTSPLSREGRGCPAGRPAGFNVGPLGHLRRGSRATAHAGGGPPSPLRDGVAPLPIPQDRRLIHMGLNGHHMPDSLISHHHRDGMATEPRTPKAYVGVCDVGNREGRRRQRCLRRSKRLPRVASAGITNRKLKLALCMSSLLRVHKTPLSIVPSLTDSKQWLKQNSPCACRPC